MENTTNEQTSHGTASTVDNDNSVGLKAVVHSFFPPLSKLKKADWIPTSMAGLTIKSVTFQLLLLYLVSLTADYAGKVAFV
jgi:hypothetical protein